MFVDAPLFAVAAFFGASSAVAVILWLRAGSTGLRGSPLIGSLARVAVAIPVHGTGAIAHVQGGRRATLPARSCENEPLGCGTWVVVVDIERRKAVVHSLPEELQEVMRCSASF